MAVIITFSGLVGTGKSVCSRYVSSSLCRKGLPVYYLRYRFLSPRSFFTPKKQISKFRFKETLASPQGHPKKRFANFSPHSPLRLLLVSPWYLLRAYFLLILVNVRYANDIVIVDRYFYDHLSHYQLLDESAAWIFRLIGRILPKPQLPFLLYADFEAVKKARPGYDDEYIKLNLKNYRKLPILFPETILEDSEPIKQKAKAVLAIVVSHLDKIGFEKNTNYGRKK